MKVILLNSPVHQDALSVIYSACRQCYSSDFVGDLYPYDNICDEKKRKLIQHVILSGHLSTIEHISFTFAISDISRSICQQLTRHRIASYSMQSQRYCNVYQMNVNVPDSIKKNKEDYDEYIDIVNRAKKFYFEKTTRSINPIPFEDARDILPLGIESNIVVTMNCRSLLNFFSERLCKTAQKDIRKLASKMLKKCQKVLPEVFENINAKCYQLGYCPENKKRSCGLFPLKDEVFEIYEKYKNCNKIKK